MAHVCYSYQEMQAVGQSSKIQLFQIQVTLMKRKMPLSKLFQSSRVLSFLVTQVLSYEKNNKNFPSWMHIEQELVNLRKGGA